MGNWKKYIKRILDNTNGLKSVSMDNNLTSVKKVFNKVKIFPNPATGGVYITLDTNASIKIKVSIYDIQGRFINTIESEKDLVNGLQTLRYDVGNFKQGLYFLEIRSDNQVRVQKLQIN